MEEFTAWPSTYRVFKFFLLSSALFSCGPHSRRNDGQKKEDFFELLAKKHNFSKLVVINSLSENMTLVSKPLDEEQKVDKNVNFIEGEHALEVPCHAPNDFVKVGNSFWLTCSLSDSLLVFSEENFLFEGVVKTSPLRNPWSVTEGSAGKLWVSGWVSDQLLSFVPKPESHFELTSMSPRFTNIDKTNLASNFNDALPKPAGVLVSGSKVLVALNHLRPNSASGGKGYVMTLDEVSGAVISYLPSTQANTVGLVSLGLPEEEKYIALNAGSYDWEKGGYQSDGGLDFYVKGEFQKNVSIPGAPLEMVASPDSTEIFVTDGSAAQVFTVSPESGEVEIAVDLKDEECSNHRPPESFKYLSALAVDADYLYVAEFSGSCIFIIERKTKNIVARIETGDGPEIIYGL